MRLKYFLPICVVLSFTIGLQGQSFCDFLRKVRACQDSVKLIEINDDGCEVPIIDRASFDINVYLNLFDKLRLGQGKEGHLIGAYNTSSGSPMLYATDSTFNESKYVEEIIEETINYWDSVKAEQLFQYRNKGLSEEKIAKIEDRYERMVRCFDRDYAMIRYAADSTNRLCNNLIPQDTREGYLQYLFFHQMGEEFALYWHSYYGEKKVLCDKKDVENYLVHYNERRDLFSFEEAKIQELMDLDLSPKVILQPGSCKITWYEIFTHRGIFKMTYEIERKPPFQVEKVLEKEVASISTRFFY